jgi:hypothetical protein
VTDRPITIRAASRSPSPPPGISSVRRSPSPLMGHAPRRYYRDALCHAFAHDARIGQPHAMIQVHSCAPAMPALPSPFSHGSPALGQAGLPSLMGSHSNIWEPREGWSSQFGSGSSGPRSLSETAQKWGCPSHKRLPDEAVSLSVGGFSASHFRTHRRTAECQSRVQGRGRPRSSMRLCGKAGRMAGEGGKISGTDV